MGIFDFLKKPSNKVTEGVKVKDKMTPNPIVVSGNTNITQIEKIFDNNRIWSIYVGDSDKFIGVITRKDIQNRGMNKSKSAPAYSIMSKGVISIDENADVEEAKTLLYDKKINGLAVTRNGKHCGIITRYDITKKGSKHPDKNGDAPNPTQQPLRHGFIWTDEEIQLLKQLWGERKSIQIIADRLKRNTAAVVHSLIDTGLVGYSDDNCDPKPPRFGFAWSPEENNQLTTEFKSGKRIPEIAAKHQRNKNAILRRLLKLHIIDFNDRNMLEKYSKKNAIEETNSPIPDDNEKITILPHDADTWFISGESLANLGRYDDAIYAFDQAIEFNPKNARFWRNKGYALTKLRRYDEAISAFDRSIDLNPKYARTWRNKGYALAELGSHNDAVKAYDRAIELDPKNARAWQNKGFALAELGRHDDAIYAFDQAIKLGSNNAITWGAQGVSLSNIGHFDDAVIVLDHAIELDPDNAITWSCKGYSLSNLGRYDDAVKAYDRAIELDPANKNTINDKEIVLKAIKDRQNLQQTSSPAKIVHLSGPNPNERSHIIAPDLIIERTIFDPVSGTFLISKDRPLVNVESWIRKTDPNSYWLIICIHNNSSSLIDEWGVELDSSASLRILECHIEGVEHTPVLNESHPVPWQSKWIIGVPHHFGITLPRNGSRRLYFKLSSSTCGVSHSVKGRLIAPDGIQIPILEKLFDHSCDVATLSTAFSKNPAAAEQYTENLLMSSYSRETALKYIQSFKLVQEISQSCAIGNHDATIDKLNQLIDALEGTQVSPSLIESVKSNLWAIQQLGDTEDASLRGQRLCRNIVDEWLNEVIYKQKKLG